MSVELARVRRVDGMAPPASEEAEGAVLASCIIDPRVVTRVRSTLAAEHFWSARHALIYQAILAVVDHGRPLDVVSVGEHLRDNARLGQVGGMSALTDLINSGVASLPHAAQHAQVVYDKWRVREAIRRCQLALAHGYNDYGDAQEYLTALRKDISRLADAGQQAELEVNLSALKRLVQTVTARAHRADQNDDGVTGLPTGLRVYDRATAGLHGTHLTIVGARPGVGKTALLGQWASSIAACGAGVGFISLEMTRDEILERLVCARGTLDTGAMRSARLSTTDWARFTSAASDIARWPLWIDDRPSRTIGQIREAAFQFLDLSRAAGVPLGAIFLDYLQYIAPTLDKRGNPPPPREVFADASKGLKTLAKELGIPIVAAAALNRDVDKAGKVRWPRKSDLRDCGNIESDADVVVLIHRDARVIEDREEYADDGKALLIIDKQRSGGRSGDVLKVHFEGRYSRFTDGGMLQ